MIFRTPSAVPLASSYFHPLSAIYNGVTVLGQRGQLNREGRYVPPPVIKVDGITIAGYRDPLEYEGTDPDGSDRPINGGGPPRPGSIARTLAESAARMVRLASEKAGRGDGPPERPGAGAGQQLVTIGFKGRLTIVTGHDHLQHVDRYGQIVVVDGGTLGAGGIFGAGRDSIGIARLSFTECMRARLG